MRYELSDHEWTAIKPMLPNKPRGVRRVNAVACSMAYRYRSPRYWSLSPVFDGGGSATWLIDQFTSPSQLIASGSSLLPGLEHLPELGRELRTAIGITGSAPLVGLQISSHKPSVLRPISANQRRAVQAPARSAGRGPPSGVDSTWLRSL